MSRTPGNGHPPRHPCRVGAKGSAVPRLVPSPRPGPNRRRLGDDAGDNVRSMVTTVESVGEAVFMDLDRTLLRGASGLVLGGAMRAEGLFDGRPSLPGESLFYRLYDLQGESLAFMAMVRAAPRFTSGWDAGTVRRA